jgi:hypothetical protein
MAAITLVGSIEHFPGNGGSEQIYTVVDICNNQWVTTEFGKLRYGPGMDLVYSSELWPEYEPSEGEDEGGWSLMNGYHTVYRTEDKFIEQCAVDQDSLLIEGDDILVCPKWAIACLVDFYTPPGTEEA